MATIYSGTKSVDAEIVINFSNNSVVMDYSNNEKGAEGNSDYGLYYESEWKTLPVPVRLKQAFITTFALFVERLILPFIVVTVTLLQSNGYLLSEKHQYAMQQLRKWFCVNKLGTVEIIQRITSTNTVIHIPHNLWVQYELSDNASKYIQEIRLIRHFDNFYRFGKYHEIRQNGWDIVFIFTTLPENSLVSVRYV